MCTKIERRPGKLEGEPCITLVMLEWANMEYLDDDEEGVQCTRPPISDSEFEEVERMSGESICQECRTDMRNSTEIRFWEDNSGFAYSEVLEGR